MLPASKRIRTICPGCRTRFLSLCASGLGRSTSLQVQGSFAQRLGPLPRAAAPPPRSCHSARPFSSRPIVQEKQAASSPSEIDLEQLPPSPTTAAAAAEEPASGGSESAAMLGPDSSAEEEALQQQQQQRQEQASRTETPEEEKERIVRQARQTFGQTLPEGYLSEEEYKLYERLYGPPLRKTQPEDVGIPQNMARVAAEAEVDEPPWADVLLRETEPGILEEVKGYTVNASVTGELPLPEDDDGADASTDAVITLPFSDVPFSDAYADANAAAAAEPTAEHDAGLGAEHAQEAVEGQEELVIDEQIEALDDPDAVVREYAEGFEEQHPELTEEQIEYLRMTANNEREYKALLQLQRDFEVTALEEKRRVEAAEAAAREAEWGEEQDEAPKQEEEEEEEGEEDDDTELGGAAFQPDHTTRDGRYHEATVKGYFRTNPSTVFLPARGFTQPISEMLRRASMTHVREAAQAAFGGPGLPDSCATPLMKGTRPMKGIALQPGQHKMSPIEADAYMASVLPGVYASVLSILVDVRKRMGSDWIRGLIARDGGKGPRVLDVGGGGAALVAWQEVLRAEWEGIRDSRDDTAGELPPSKNMVVVGSNDLRHRISAFLQDTTFLPRLPDYLHSIRGAERMLESDGSARPHKTFDIIIVSHSLMALDKEYRRRELVDNLWTMLSEDGGVLVVVEKGHPRGFEAVAEVRSRLLEEFLIPPGARPTDEMSPPVTEEEADVVGHVKLTREREPGMIIAPCTNHTKCPMYLTPGVSQGRKDFCHFAQRFVRPAFLSRLHGLSGARNHEDIKFSFLAVRRGTYVAGHEALLHGDEAVQRAFAGYEASRPALTSAQEPAAGAQETEDPAETRQEGTDSAYAAPPPPAPPPPPPMPHPLSLPRNILSPLKRRGHVTLDLCTPAGKIERWTVPKSFSLQAYHDARKAKWGDLWALGAKTRTPRNVRLGRAHALVLAAAEAEAREDVEAQTQAQGAEAIAGSGTAPSSPSAATGGHTRGPRRKGKKKAFKEFHGDGGVRDRDLRERAERGKRARVVELHVDPRKGLVGTRERKPQWVDAMQRRAKQGQRIKIDRLLEEMGIEELEKQQERDRHEVGYDIDEARLDRMEAELEGKRLPPRQKGRGASSSPSRGRVGRL